MDRFVNFNKRDSRAQDLSYRALNEVLYKGQTTYLCPMCHTKPEFDIEYTPQYHRLERVTGGCYCGYIFVGFVT